ncbi:calcium channel subunit Mid1 [Cordyceps fumosorosea ARSEF 2679]|uniref:Calcium channel subunit Mid1 n=1 Tax=Cordyceps fumosorosea (strain ARSEF 2679) TaxID=1081104 RepID=A0A167YFM3_CORFA|nr:calcium channel subunit Mid1 [Cordyceps fumosorosea ARSEF 2679]OAA66267.1 calcium channel subunit Mid1 [Cordyceps fumosorosea ARSEF 2679]
MPFRLLRSQPAPSLAAAISTLLFILAVSPAVAVAESAANIGSTNLDGYKLDLDLGDTYEPSFAPFDSSYLGKRANVIGPLVNNVPSTSNLKPGEAACYQIKKTIATDSQASGTNARRFDLAVEAATNSSAGAGILARQDSQKLSIFLSANTCLQPWRVPGADKADMEPPQLTLLISNSSQLGCPDLSMQDTPNIQKQTFEGGAVMFSTNMTEDLFISVQAPNVSSSYQGGYFFELAASTQDYYHRYVGKEGQLLWLDSDASSALLVSKNLTINMDESKRIMEQGMQYQFYIDNELFPRLLGIEHSTCGLKTNAQIYATPNGTGNLNQLVHMTMTTRGPGGFPKQQFFITGLNDTTEYRGIIVQTPNATVAKRDGEGIVGGGGTVFTSTAFNTVSGTSCKMVTDLDFCDEIQYAVPGNVEKFQGNDSILGQTYDDYAKTMYDNFEKVLMLMQCEAPSTKRYSLMKTCDDCRRAYKKWLCTVVMPRCEDYAAADAPHSIVRNAGQPFPNGTRLPAAELALYAGIPASNTSRNNFIDETIAPGPYRELLPCDDLCYEVVQSCPAAMQLSCPLRKNREYPSSYARRDPDNLEVTCNYPGEPRTRVSAAAGVVWNAAFVSAAILLSVGLLW